ncbi:MAG: lipid A biosynthesis acyltransferase [Stenotrophobium sp.]
MSQNWQQQQERSNPLMLRMLLWIARAAGRRVARHLLYPIVGYFLLTGGAARRASRNYLRRVLGREPGWRDTARHFHAFASVSLDRFFLLGGNTQNFDIRIDRPQAVYDLSQSQRGCLLLLAHLGSFEVFRVRGLNERKLPLRILMDTAHNRMFISILRKLNPQLMNAVIDASQGGPALVLALKQALDEGSMIGMMSDRYRQGERVVKVDFLGGQAQLPASPWILAGTLGVPVILAFGLYRGGNRYDVHFELMSERLALPRANREQALQAHAQRYADRVQHHLRSAPYNWFNFYDYWQS